MRVCIREANVLEKAMHNLISSIFSKAYPRGAEKVDKFDEKLSKSSFHNQLINSYTYEKYAKLFCCASFAIPLF